MNDKLGRRLFLAGAIVLTLAGLVHSLSLIGKPVPANDTERQLMDLMVSYKFNLMGSMRSMDNFLRGFSFSFMVGILAMAGVDLGLSRERTGVLKRLALINAIWLATMTVISLRYFFVMPTSFLVVALTMFVLAWWKLPGTPS